MQKSRSPGSTRLYRLDDRARELLVAGGDHVEGAVGLYVLDLHVVVAGELAQGAELVDATRRGPRPATSAISRRPKPTRSPYPEWMPDRDAVLLGQRDGLAHDVRVAGVEAARDVGGGDVVHHLLVKAHLPRAEALAHVAVEINLHGAHLPLGTRLAHGLLDLRPSAAAAPRGPRGPRRGPRSGSGSCRWSWSGPVCRGPRL